MTSQTFSIFKPSPLSKVLVAPLRIILKGKIKFAIITENYFVFIFIWRGLLLSK